MRRPVAQLLTVRHPACRHGAWMLWTEAFKAVKTLFTAASIHVCGSLYGALGIRL